MLPQSYMLQQMQQQQTCHIEVSQPAAANWREGLQLADGHHGGGRQHEVDTAGHSPCRLAGQDALVGQVGSDEGGGAGSVGGDAGPAKIKSVCQPVEVCTFDTSA